MFLIRILLCLIVHSWSLIYLSLAQSIAKLSGPLTWQRAKVTKWFPERDAVFCSIFHCHCSPAEKSSIKISMTELPKGSPSDITADFPHAQTEPAFHMQINPSWKFSNVLQLRNSKLTDACSWKSCFEMISHCDIPLNLAKCNIWS